LAELNDIALEPDPQRLVTRGAHCTLERHQGSWILVDNRSANRTFVRRGQVDEAVTRQVVLDDGDVIRILARSEVGKEPVYWELMFRDPQRTNRFGAVPPATYLHYDPVQAKLFRIVGADRHEISNLRPQEHKLIRYMALRNQANGNVAVMCTYDELIKAIWGDEFRHTEAEINHLVWELRQKLETAGIQPLQVVKGLGYRLKLN
jgi:hypothetical protein